MFSMRIKSKGTIHFKDVANNLTLDLKLDSVSKKPSDYFEGFIKKGEEKVSKVYGSYMGFC